MEKKIQRQGRERLGKETYGQKRIKQKVRPGAGKKSQKKLCLIGKTINSCCVKGSFFSSEEFKR